MKTLYVTDLDGTLMKDGSTWGRSATLPLLQRKGNWNHYMNVSEIIKHSTVFYNRINTERNIGWNFFHKTLQKQKLSSGLRSYAAASA